MGIELHILLQQLFNGLALGSTYGLIAIGYTMVYGIIGMINFAHGEIFMIAAYLTAICIALLSILGLNFLPVVIILTLLFCIVINSVYGFVLERIAYRPLRESTRLAPFISAIGMSLVLQNYVAISQGTDPQGIKVFISWGIRLGEGQNYVQIRGAEILIIIASIIGVSLLSYLIQKTRLGREFRATQQDRIMASILGINTNFIISMVFVIGAGMAGMAGFLYTLNYGSFDFHTGFIIGIKAFTAAVLGGIGSIPGAMLGGILLGLSESLFAGIVNTDYKDVFAFLVLILVLTFKPSGLLGQPEVEKI